MILVAVVDIFKMDCSNLINSDVTTCVHGK